ncbi:MAG: hypothetical protein JW765_12465 [Deltaproteobacteria bacterium]|nr:hypothetical protein [Candidatus Zymogenaceae bacterium]
MHGPVLPADRGPELPRMFGRASGHSIGPKMPFAVAKFQISKEDLYSIIEVKTFPDLAAAEEYYASHGYGDKFGGTWQERWEYRVVEVTDGLYYLPGGGRVWTVLDRE